jgi:ubiquinone/menaquinone biosynthesis C-methylase UbiE
MTSRALPIIYERLWRPIGVWLAFGAIGVGGAIEHDETFEMLELDRDDVVLDVACGPGNVTRRLLGWIGKPGLVVGLDASPSMLERAVRDTDAPNAAYVRADAHRLPFRHASFDAVCCYAALYLMDEPFAAIEEMLRVLRPGGRIAVLTSCHRGPAPLRPLASLVTSPGGIRVFGRDQITDSFRAHGLDDVRQRVTGLAQFGGARKPT